MFSKKLKLQLHQIVRFSCVVITLFILLGTMNVSALAQPKLTVGSGSGHKGDTVNISINLEKPENIAGIQFLIKYDAGSLSVSESDITKGTSLSQWYLDKNVIKDQGEIRLAYASGSLLKEKNPIEVCNIKFTIKNEAGYCETPIIIDSIFVGNGTNKIQVGSSNGKITVLNTPSNPQQPSNPQTSPLITPAPSVTPANNIEDPIIEMPAAGKFKDIENHWAAEKIISLVNAGIVNGYPDGTIKPNAKITRAEVVTILVKALEPDIDGSLKTSFADSDQIPEWSSKFVSYAVANNIIKGYDDNTFKPNKNMTRSEMAVVIIKAFSFDTYEDSSLNFKDHENIPSWAKVFVSSAVRNNIISGYEDNTFRPSKDITRAEAFVMLERAMVASGNLK